MPPKDIQSLIDKLLRDRAFQGLTNNLLTAWGPANKQLLGAQFLPPRLLEENAGTIEDVHYRTIAAADGSRYSPAQIVDGGEMFGSIRYQLGNSDIARQMVGPDYDGLTRWLNRSLPMQAAAAVIGFFNRAVIQALTEHDELAIWDAIVFNKLQRRGDNGYYEYENGPSLSGHRVAAGGDWTSSEYDPWDDIFARVKVLTDLGYEKSGIRIVTTDQTATILKGNPHTAQRAGNSVLVTNGSGVVSSAAVNGPVNDAALEAIFRANGLQGATTYDIRISTRTGQRRAYPEGHMTFIASTGRSEEIRYNEDNISDVRIVEDTLGFNGIGKANGENEPGRRAHIRAFTDRKDKRIEMEGYQTTGPIILEPSAITDISGIGDAVSSDSSSGSDSGSESSSESGSESSGE